MGFNGNISGKVSIMIKNDNILINSEILNQIARIDRFNGVWEAKAVRLSVDQLNVMKRVATIESVGSSNRIEGNKLSNQEVEELFSKLDRKSFRSRDEEEIAGYADLINTIFDNFSEIPLTENYIKHLHKILLGHSSKDERHRGEYKKDSNRVAAFDENGNEIGTVFETASAFDTPRLMQELLTWTNATLEDRYFHPLITIGVFIVHFLAIHPFTDGNGRLSRGLTLLMLLRCRYAYVPYSSMESIVEASKDSYYRALRTTQKTIWNDAVNYTPWLTYFVTALQRQVNVLEEKLKISAEQRISELSVTARRILSLFNAESELTMKEIIEKTELNSETVRKSVQGLVKKQLLVKFGVKKGASYKRVGLS